MHVRPIYGSLFSHKFSNGYVPKKTGWLGHCLSVRVVCTKRGSGEWFKESGSDKRTCWTLTRHIFPHCQPTPTCKWCAVYRYRKTPRFY